MAGIMLRAVRNFRTGDFLRVGDNFGRVSERGLFHTEIQTEDRDLTTLPNLYLVTNPVTVMRTSGTIVSGRVSLGYDVPCAEVERLLLDAGRQAGLEEPYVQILELGDFSVTYRLAGLLTEVKRLLSARARLLKSMLNTLHEGGVEIVSPTFMATRAQPPGQRVIPRRQGGDEAASEAGAITPEAIVFDKADEAESVERLKQILEVVAGQIRESRESLEKAEADEERERLERDVERLEKRRSRLLEILEAREGDDG